MARTPLSSGSLLIRSTMVLLLIVLLGLIAYPHIQDYLETLPDKGDYRADPKLLDQLTATTLPGSSAPSPGTDWPQWRGPNRDGISSDSGLLANWPKEGPPLLWKVKGGPGHSSSAIAAGRVYTLLQDGDHEVILCLDAADGAERWRYRFPGKFHEPSAGTGPHGTPTVQDGRVYAVGAMGMFHCLDAATGKVLWKHNLREMFSVPPQEYGMSFSPLIEGNLVITLPGSPDGASVVAFDSTDGRLVWKSSNDRPGYSSPLAATIAGTRQLVVFTGESVMGIAPADGAVYWRFPWATRQDCNAATPIVIGNYVFISSNYAKGCALLHIVPPPSTAPEGTKAGWQALPVYEHNRMRNHFATSVLWQDHFYGFDDAFLVCMELRTGKVLWKQRGFQKGSLLVADGRLIVLGENGVLALAEANPLHYREIATFTLSNSLCWAMPALAGGRLYIRDQEHIFCLNLRDKE